MKTLHRTMPPRAVILALVLLAGARADEATSSIRFSNPAQPGTVRVNLGRGELRVEGVDTSEVTVKSAAKPAQRRTRDGLRVISEAAGISLTEKGNVVTIDAATHDPARSGGALRLTVPRNTTLIVENAWGGNITCTGISGDIEVNSMHGEIQLDDIAGSVVASTMNGRISATIRELRDGKPISFTSMNGEVVVRVPENAKANVRLRTQHGSVLTDFEENALVTKTETTDARGRSAFTWKGNRILSTEIQEAIREAAQVSATAIKEALEAVKEGLEAARLSADDARREMDEARRELDRMRHSGDDQPPAAPSQPKPPRMSITPSPKPPAWPGVPSFTLSGGKIVSGTLNGGGPEISVATMNGDVVLRKRQK